MCVVFAERRLPASYGTFCRRCCAVRHSCKLYRISAFDESGTSNPLFFLEERLKGALLMLQTPATEENLLNRVRQSYP